MCEWRERFFFFFKGKKTPTPYLVKLRRGGRALKRLQQIQQ